MEPAAAVALAAFLTLASLVDLRTGRVPNLLNAAAVLAGLTISSVTANLLDALLGRAAGFGVGFVLYAVGALRGGDGKMLAAVGALGGLRFLGDATLATLLSGAVVAVIVLASDGSLIPLFRRLGKAFVAVTVFQFVPEDPIVEGEGHRIPFAPVIAAGCGIAWLAKNHGWALFSR